MAESVRIHWPGEAPDEVARACVLLVDPDPTTQRAVVDALEAAGLAVHVAGSAMEGLLFADEHAGEFQVAIIDRQPPEMDVMDYGSCLAMLAPGLRVLRIVGPREALPEDEDSRSYLRRPIDVGMLVEKVKTRVFRRNRPISAVIAEDDKQLRGLLRLALAEAGMEVMEAENGAVAVQQLRAHPADVLVIDLLMPEQEGLETIRILRREMPGLKIIAMSGAADFLPCARLLGAHAVLCKPFRLADLVGAVRALARPGDGQPAAA